MGLLDFFNKQQNTISDDGLNLIYSKEDGYYYTHLINQMEL